MKDTTLHMIGNAHLDPVWLWQWQEGFQETKATFRSALDRMRESDDFVFTSSSAAIYEWVEHNDPQMFAEIRQRIAEGRWQIVGGWWVQADCNLPCGESFARQALYGQRYFKAKFGVTASVGYNVDSFGHHGMLPQILKQSGMDAYVFLRPSPNEKGLPGRLFWWESDDGSRVLTFRIPYEYGTWGKDLDKYVRRCIAELKDPLRDIMCFYGVGNHGGGPTTENLQSIRRLNESLGFARLVFSTPDQFFSAVAMQDLPLPVVHDDLQHHASGCYAAHSGVKRWNRQAENHLLLAEKYASLADWLTGQPYPVDFGRAWKNVLFNQFHDILAGTSIEAAYDDARNLYGEAMSIAGRALNDAIQSIAWRIKIDPEAGMKPIVVFNPHAWASTVNVELEFGRLKETEVLLDDTDRQVPVQVVQSAAAARGRNRLSFIADLPPLGYRVYRVAARPNTIEGTPLRATDCSLENDRFRLEFDPQTGWIGSLYDKHRQLNVFIGPAARPVVIEDRSDTWSHDVLAFDTAIGDFTARSVRLVEHGAVKSVVRVTSEYGASRLVQDFTMYRELEQIDVHVTVDWREEFKMLKLKFPMNLNFIRATYEIPYGHIERPVNGEEEPGQSWIDVSGESRDVDELYGLSLLNDGKYSFDVRNKELSLTVLRSPIYAHHDPFVPQPDGQYSFIDQGIQRFSYTLLPHSGSWEQAGTIKRAAELNQRPIALIETYHEHGTLPQCDSYLAVEQGSVVVSALKQAEESDDLIVRCYETHKAQTDATIRLPKWNRTISATFGPCEIKTFRVPKDPALPIVETNLLEWTAQEMDPHAVPLPATPLAQHHGAGGNGQRENS
ncbi:MAG TPA: glycoside hydrolase family 38 C-terminal domain-containing protein [Herpetosiphonaceae bacterium]